MKTNHVFALLQLLTALMLFAMPAFAEGGTPPGNPTASVRDFSSTNLPATYGASANQISAAGSGKTHVCLKNTAATYVFYTWSATTNCTGASDKGWVPDGDGVCFDFEKGNTNLCARSESGTLSSGKLYWKIW